MTDETPKRPWWRERRAWAAAVGLLIAAHVASTGPATYFAHRGWLPATAYVPFCWPAMRALNCRAGVLVGYWRYVGWWEDLGRRHAAP